MPRTFRRRRTAVIKRIQRKVFHITPSEEDLEQTLFYRKPQQEEDEEEESDTESMKSQQTDAASVETIKPQTIRKLRKILTIKIPRSNFITMRIPRPNIDGTVHLSGQHYNQCDKATNKDQAREKVKREREREEREVRLNGSKRSHQ